MGQLTSSLHILRKKEFAKTQIFAKTNQSEGRATTNRRPFHPARAAPPLQGGSTGDQYFSISPSLSSATRDKFLEQEFEIFNEQLLLQILFYGILRNLWIIPQFNLKLYCITELL